MGQVVSSDSGRDTIVADVKATLVSATARGGALKADAEAGLGDTLALWEVAEGEAKAESAAAAAARAERAVANDVADAVVVEVLDELFEAGGRKRNDPFLAIAAPGGASPIVNAGLETQPTRMRLAAKVLGKVKHPRIPKETLVAAAERIAAAAKPLAKVIAETSEVILAADVSDQTLTALAKLMRADLMALKRKWIGQQMSESEVHQIIPDRPDAPTKKKDAET